MKMLPLILFFFSCDFYFGMQDLNIGTCVQEINKNYVPSAETPKASVYKVESKKGRNYFLSTYHNRDWLFLKERPRAYFSENKNFKYEVIECPGTYKEDDKSISDRIDPTKFLKLKK